jgi:ABC-type amino acid transport substrate-binding protein
MLSRQRTQNILISYCAGIWNRSFTKGEVKHKTMLDVVVKTTSLTTPQENEPQPSNPYVTNWVQYTLWNEDTIKDIMDTWSQKCWLCVIIPLCIQCTTFGQSKWEGYSGMDIRNKKINKYCCWQEEGTFIPTFISLKVRFDILKAVATKTTGSQNQTSSNLVERYQFFKKNMTSIFTAEDFY